MTSSDGLRPTLPVTWKGPFAVKLKRTISLAGVALVSAFALVACGSDSNGSGGSSGESGGAAASGDCPKGTLNASGSTAQANAMSEWIKAYRATCPGATINYNAVGLRPGHHGLHQRPDLVRRLRLGRSTPDKGEVAAADKRCKTGKAVNLPMVPGPIAVVFNVTGVTDLTFTPSVLAQDLRRQGHQVERPGDRRAQQRRQAAGRRRS